MCRKQSKASPLDLLEQACQSWPPGERGLGHNSTDWQHQLRSLVQAGIPMVCSMHMSKDTVDKPSISTCEQLIVVQTLRGKMWHTFLGLEAVKKEGYYEQLVFQALGNKYTKRKVGVLTDVG